MSPRRVVAPLKVLLVAAMCVALASCALGGAERADSAETRAIAEAMSTANPAVSSVRATGYNSFLTPKSVFRVYIADPRSADLIGVIDDVLAAAWHQMDEQGDSRELHVFLYRGEYTDSDRFPNVLMRLPDGLREALDLPATTTLLTDSIRVPAADLAARYGTH